MISMDGKMKSVYFKLSFGLCLFGYVDITSAFLENHPSNPPMITISPYTKSTKTTPSTPNQTTKSSTTVTTKQSTSMPTTSSTSVPLSGGGDVKQQLEQLTRRINILENENSQLTKKVISLEGEIQSLNAMASELTCARNSVQDVAQEVDRLLRVVNTNGTINPPISCPTSAPRHISGNRTGLSTDCYDILQNGNTQPGVYDLQLEGSIQVIKAYCDQGWTYIQKRDKGLLDFWTPHWDNYIVGFGDPAAEYWLGNDNVYEITKQSNYILRIEALGWTGKSYWAEYTSFSIKDEANDYQLSINGYHGNYKDLMAGKNGTDFSTTDQNNDNGSSSNCAAIFGPWWYGKCEKSLNGFWQNNVYTCMSFANRCVKTSLMKIKPEYAV